MKEVFEQCDGCGESMSPSYDFLCPECRSASAEVPQEEAEDSINPNHYKSHPSGVECIEIVRHMNFNCGNAVEYIWRNGLKDGNPLIQELEKAIWHLNDEIKRLKLETKKVEVNCNHEK